MQKHVGHTMVQLPQVRQRLATCDQCGDSRESTSSARRSVSGIARPIIVAARAISASAAAHSPAPAGRLGTPARICAPASLPTSTR